MIPRTDLYLRDAAQTELGIKRRGNKPGYEVKGIVERLAQLTDSPFIGHAELWAKWSTERLRFNVDEMIPITKLRWIRKLDMAGTEPREVELGNDENPRDADDYPALGCQMEFTRISVSDETWWSFSFESFGKLATVERHLRAAAATMAEREPPKLTSGVLASYPAWLGERIHERT